MPAHHSGAAVQERGQGRDDGGVVAGGPVPVRVVAVGEPGVNHTGRTVDPPVGLLCRGEELPCPAGFPGVPHPEAQQAAQKLPHQVGIPLAEGENEERFEQLHRCTRIEVPWPAGLAEAEVRDVEDRVRDGVDVAVGELDDVRAVAEQGEGQDIVHGRQRVRDAAQLQGVQQIELAVRNPLEDRRIAAGRGLRDDSPELGVLAAAEPECRIGPRVQQEGGFVPGDQFTVGGAGRDVLDLVEERCVVAVQRFRVEARPQPHEESGFDEGLAGEQHAVRGRFGRIDQMSARSEPGDCPGLHRAPLWRSATGLRRVHRMPPGDRLGQ